MAYAVLVAWIVQASLGFWLLARWTRHGRPGPGIVIGHVVLQLTSLVLWAVFAVTGPLALAWSAFALVTVGNVLGDTLMVRRSRRLSPRGGWFAAVGDVFSGRMPRLVTVHALFSGVVYFGCLGVSIGASVAAAG